MEFFVIFLARLKLKHLLRLFCKISSNKPLGKCSNDVNFDSIELRQIFAALQGNFSTLDQSEKWIVFRIQKLNCL